MPIRGVILIIDRDSPKCCPWRDARATWMDFNIRHTQLMCAHCCVLSISAVASDGSRTSANTGFRAWACPWSDNKRKPLPTVKQTAILLYLVNDEKCREDKTNNHSTINLQIVHGSYACVRVCIYKCKVDIFNLHLMPMILMTHDLYRDRKVQCNEICMLCFTIDQIRPYFSRQKNKFQIF